MNSDIKKDNVLMAVGRYNPKVGGPARNIPELISRLTQMGYSFDIISCDRNDTDKWTNSSVNIYNFPSWQLVNGTYPIPKLTINSLKIIKKILKKDYKLIVTRSRFYLICLFALLVGKIKKIPVVHVETGCGHVVAASKIVSVVNRIYDHTIGVVLVKNAKVNVGISKKTAEFLNHLGAKNVKVVYNGINLDYFSHNYSYIKTIKKNIVITYVGRLVYSKGVQDLLAIISELSQEVNKNIVLKIVGDGPMRNNLEKISSKIENVNIVFEGRKSPEEIPKILQKTDIFVNSSYSEGLPTTVLEACASGVAIIATNVGGTNEIIIHNKTGILYYPSNTVQLKEYLVKLIEKDNLRIELGEEAKKHVRKHFNWKKICGEWLKIFDEAIRG